MIEQIRDNPSEEIKKGDLVRLKDDLDSKLIESLAPEVELEVGYRVLHIVHNADEGGDTAWIGPHDMPLQDIENFYPTLVIDTPEERYKNVFPIAAAHLRKLLD